MNTHLEQYLYEKYLEFFKDKDTSMQETCMCWGIECGDGWLHLVDRACMKIRDKLVKGEYPLTSFKFTQVKEKYGTLRLYWRFESDKEFAKYTQEDLSKIIDEVEEMSAYICEVCGSAKGARIAGRGWYSCRCSYCYAQENEDKDEI